MIKKWITPFTDIRELDEYFSQELITCLECGKEMRALGGHIRTHALTARAYKIKYNIPQRRKLVSTGTKEKLREARVMQVSSWTEEEQAAEHERSKAHCKKLSNLGHASPCLSTIKFGVYIKKCKLCGCTFETHAHKDKIYCTQDCSNKVIAKTRKRRNKE